MPLTQEKHIKPLDNNFSNNNDHSYLHKKFKKMASTLPAFTSSPLKSSQGAQKEADVSEYGSNTTISNGSISAAHPEIEKIKEIHYYTEAEKSVQINLSNENRISLDNMQIPGQTSYTEEFSNKTDNLENEFMRETQSVGTSGRVQYVCPYCKLCCAKPSVLEKHIRAHTNERPYPCVPCGFAFKTKSNLYKHRRSRTHALRLLGAEVPASANEEESGGSESDTSMPPTSSFDIGSDVNIIRNESSRPNEFSSPELTNDSTASSCTNVSVNENNKLKSIYKPKFRAAFYQDMEDKDNSRKHISSKADFLTEHISKIISDNEAIVDVIETPLQKKYNKIKLIAESKQFLNENESKVQSPLNLTKQSNENEGQFRKRSHSESFSQNDQIKNLNPEGSIIKDLLLKTKANGMQPIISEAADGIGSLHVCPLCQIMYRSADNLDIHRLYYCKGTAGNTPQPGQKSMRPENIYVRSNSVNVRLPESQCSPPMKTAKLTQSRNKPDNLTIIKPETNDVIAPLPSPGPLLGNTRLVDTRTHEFSRRSENHRGRPVVSPKRRPDNTDMYSPRLLDNVSPKTEMYYQAKLRCIDANSVALRALDEMSPHSRHNSTSLQMFGGEVKILDHSGSTTTLRIEPSKNQLSPILIHQSLSPSKLANDAEASSVVVRSGLHSGGTIVHNPPTPKDGHISSHSQTPRLHGNMHGMHDMTQFQFPPLSAITAYNPLTLPPLSPSSSPKGATTILHGGKLIPHVPGIPGPNTPGIYVGSPSPKNIVINNDGHKGVLQTTTEFENYAAANVQANKTVISKYDRMSNMKSPNLRNLHVETDRLPTPVEEPRYTSPVPIIKVKNVDETNQLKTMSVVKTPIASSRLETPLKRNSDGIPKIQIQKELKAKPQNKDKNIPQILEKHTESKAETEIRHFNFENLITKAEIYNNHVSNSTETLNIANSSVNEVSANALNERSETSYFQKNAAAKALQDERKPKFLRPSTLPLKPGTFTPKRHHGITPNANTMPLVSPETPRPAKAYGQLYLNGNAYTYLGLKCSTKVFYCTINRPQPTYVPNQHFLSMYSNWQLLSDLTPDPFGLSTASAMSLYDSRHRPQNITIATMKQDLILTHSSQWNENSKENKDDKSATDVSQMEDNKVAFQDSNLPKKELTGGFESNEEYTYVRGRGRGRYVCSECGIRCKKPSMLKKHIRTHTDVRPYTCIHCSFSFKTKGNLTKHMKSKAHYKKCCELGINPNEGQDTENGETTQCSGETDDDSESDGDEGNEGETESSDTEFCKSRLPDHEAAHCLLSLGGARPVSAATTGLMSARPSTYPYTPATGDNALEISSDRSQLSRSSSIDSRIDMDNEPMDLSKTDVKVNITEIPTARESSVLASLASNTAKLPQQQSQWTNGEPMLHTYLTERALLDSKIKQSQLSYNLNKKMDLEKSMFKDNLVFTNSGGKINKSMHIEAREGPPEVVIQKIKSIPVEIEHRRNSVTSPKEENIPSDSSTNTIQNTKFESERKARTPSISNAENAKQVVSEYLKQAKINLILDDNKVQSQGDNAGDDSKNMKISSDDSTKEELSHSDSESIKMPSMDHDSVARKVVVGMGGMAFKVSKGKDFEGGASYAPNRLMEDGRRVCDFCNKTFTKPSQLRLHLNIHYMERPFRCSVCAVSFRTRGHLQKHERSGSHHNKVSMTSTFGAATSFNPRPFRCFDCNIAFRIHGHLAKHLRSKMHVMRLECLFKLPFGTFTEIERAGVSLTEIDTTDCASSLASLQNLARKLHEKDPTKLEYREPNNSSPGEPSSSIKDSVEEESVNVEQANEDLEKNSEKTIETDECNEKAASYL